MKPATVLALVLLAAQEPRKKDIDLIDPVRVDEAIKKGVGFLRSAESPSAHEEIRNSDELILLTYLHAGVPRSDAKLQELLKGVLDAPLGCTYKVALQAMALEEIDRVKHQKRIYHCAQFLVDNQCANGQWSYGEPTELDDPPVSKEVATDGAGKGGVKVFDDGSSGAPAAKPKVVRKIAVKKKRDAEGDGDNSNSQYAALGLRACHDAGILFPRETVERAMKWWRLAQEDGAKAVEEDDDVVKKKPPPSVPTGPGSPAKPFGWEYGEGGKGTGSMTAGAVGALVIGNALLGKNWKTDRDVAEGVAWLAKNFTVTRNPGADEWHYYYLYAIERVGMLCDIERIGTHPWYSTGAKYLLDAQKPDGSWKAEEEGDSTWDTCFAILFLKRATRRIDVATVGGGNKEK